MKSSTLLCHLAIALSCIAAPMAAQVHPGIGVRVRAPSMLFDRFEGVYLGRQGDKGDTLLFGNDARGPIKVPASAITQMEVSDGRSRLRGALHGALWGGGVAAIIGGLAGTISVEDSLASSSPAFIAEIAAGGAELGAIIGAIVGRRVWKETHPQIFMNTTRSSLHAIGVQLAVRYTR